MTHQDDRIAEERFMVCPPTHNLLMPSVIQIGPGVSAAVGPLPVDCPQSGPRRCETWTGLVLSSMPEKSWLVAWDQSRKASIHSGWSLKFVEMMLISEMEINALHACVKILGLVALSVPPTHDATSAVPLQQNALQQGGGVAAQQNSQPIISPPVVQVHLQPVLLPPDQPIPPQAVLPVLTSTSVVQPVVAVEQHSLASATARNAAETQQLATGEDSAAAEEHSSSDNHQPKEEEDSDADDN